MGRRREINPKISVGEVLIRIHFKALLSLVGQVSCRGVIFFAIVPTIKKKKDKPQNYSGMLLNLFKVL